jgi:hypothetical protein
MKKARGDAVLKTLPDALQEETYQRCRRTTYPNVVDWLQEKHGIETNPGSLSKFFDWYARKGWVGQCVSIADQIKTEAAKIPEMRKQAQTVGEIAQLSFEILAAQNRDSKFYLDLTRERREERRFALEREKHEWAKKTDRERGLDAVAEEFETCPEALELFNQARAKLDAFKEAKG